MKITVKTAKKMMRQNRAVVRRYGDDGTQLPDATTWAPDQTWSICAADGERYVIVDDIHNQTIHHVAL